MEGTSTTHSSIITKENPAGCRIIRNLTGAISGTKFYCSVYEFDEGPVFVDINWAIQTCAAMGVGITDTNEIKDYLAAHRDLIQIIVYACCLASDKFGNRAQLSLEMFSDFNSEDKHPTLYVRQKKYEDNIYQEIKQIRNEYSHYLMTISGDFHLTTDFMPPRS